MGLPNSVEQAIYQMLLGKVFGLPFLNVGNVFFVEGNTGNNALSGRTPAEAWRTILYALTQCVNNNDDVIVVLDHWQEAWPVTINKTRVHILGVSRNPTHPYVTLNSAGNNTAIFIVSSVSNNCEIAGFDFGGGVAHAGIENIAGTPMGLYVHHNRFGHPFAQNTPQDGIMIGINATSLDISDNFFCGVAAGKGTITRDGIRINNGAVSMLGVIERNTFIVIPAVGIHLLNLARGTKIKDNVFTVPDGANGEAITLEANTIGCLVDGNHAMSGGDAAMATIPFRDLSTGPPVGSGNDWGQNFASANAAALPVCA